MGLAAGLAGEAKRAADLIDKAINTAGGGTVTPFSCWTFEDETVTEFCLHCTKISEFLFESGSPPEVVERYREKKTVL
jgi:hypothetical protein